MKKRIVRVVLTVMIAAIIIPIGLAMQTDESYAVTRNQALDWVRSQVGKSIDWDGQHGAQCVDLIMAYYNALGVSPASGNGGAYATNTLPSGWSRVQGGTPQPGDILVYSGSNAEGASAEGHVAIYESDYCHYHQRFSGSYVEKVTSYKYNGLKNPYWGYIRPAFTSERFNYNIEEAGNTADGIYVKGWAYDKQSTGSQVQIHVYVALPAQEGEGHNLGLTNKTRTDVNNYYSISGTHGFETTFNTQYTGMQTVYFYAVTKDGSYNEFLEARNFHVGNNPMGTFDEVKSTCAGTIYIRGWTFDPDNKAAFNTVHAYVGGSSSNGEGHSADVNGESITADRYRADVHNTYNCGNYHGFEAYIPTNKTGTQQVYLYGINLANGVNAQLTNVKSVTISTAAHTYNSGVITKSATCTTAGQKRVTCTKCGINSNVSIPATGHQHTEIRNQKQATCGEDGYTGDTYCTDCNTKIKSGSTVQKTGEHSWDSGAVTKEASYEEEGVRTFHCVNCDATKTESIPKLTPPSEDPDDPGTNPGQNPDDPDNPAVDDPYIPEGAPSMSESQEAVTKLADKKELAGSTFGKLQARAAKNTKNSIKLKWNKVKGATGYIVYGARCGSKYQYKKLKVTTSTTWTQKKLKKGTYYKYIVMAYRNSGEEQYVIASSKSIHTITKGSKKYTVAKSLSVSKKKVTIKKGKTCKISAKEKPLVKGRKIQHHRNVSFESSNPAVATVSKAGKVKAKKAGSCKIYVYAQNGVFKTLTVKVN